MTLDSDQLRRAQAAAMTEDELLQAITDAATYLGWRWHHVRRSDLAVSQGSQGFPDLVLARDGRVLFLELKTVDGRPTQGQLAWLGAIDPDDAAGDQLRRSEALAMIVRPADLDDVLELLR